MLGYTHKHTLPLSTATRAVWQQSCWKHCSCGNSFTFFYFMWYQNLLKFQSSSTWTLHRVVQSYISCNSSLSGWRSLSVGALLSGWRTLGGWSSLYGWSSMGDYSSLSGNITVWCHLMWRNMLLIPPLTVGLTPLWLPVTELMRLKLF